MRLPDEFTFEGLTDDEKHAKRFFLHAILKGDHIRCDENYLKDSEATIPDWYNEEKFERGRSFFRKNRAGILNSSLVCLFTFFAQYRGLITLIEVDYANTPDKARKRCLSTLTHMYSWYDVDLKPGSESWKSLNMVRKMHLNISQVAETKAVGFISKMAMTLAQIGFIWYPLLRPQIFHIIHDNEAELEGFIHFWAVVGYMLGINDEYNACLLTLPQVKILTAIAMRYFYLPAVQLETPKYKKVISTILEGCETFLSKSYDWHQYDQYDVNHEGETLCRSVFTADEIKELSKQINKIPGYEYINFVLFSKVPVYRFEKVLAATGNIPEYVIIENGIQKPMDLEFARQLRDFLELDNSTKVTLNLVDYETEWGSALNNSQFHKLPYMDQLKLAMDAKFRKIVESRIGRSIINWGFTVVLWVIKSFF